MSEMIVAMGQACKCVTTHRQGALNCIYTNLGHVCENAQMRGKFPIEAVRCSISRLMDECGDKPKPLAAKLGISDNGIRDVFLEKTKSVGGPKLAAIARHYNVSVDDILSGEATTLGRNEIEPEAAIPISAETLEPILVQCLKLAPPGGWTERDAKLLARS